MMVGLVRGKIISIILTPQHLNLRLIHQRLLRVLQQQREQELLQQVIQLQHQPVVAQRH